MFKLLIHQWKESFRSAFWKKSIWLNIIMGLFTLYFIFNFLILGFFADVIIGESMPNTDVVQSFSKLLFFYFISDLFFRYMMQQIPTLAIKPYLILPIPKKKLLHFPLLKSIFSFFNFFPLILILPFYFKVICVERHFMFSMAWIITILSMILTNNFINFSIKKYIAKKPLLIIIVLLVIAGIYYLEISGKSHLSDIFARVFMHTASHGLALIFMSFAIFAYLLTYNMLKKNSYLEELHDNRKINTSQFAFLSNYGEIGNMLQLELKLILRNKRTKAILYMTILFFLYGFLFYKNEDLSKPIMLILCGTIITSMFAISYGSYFFSWNGSFYDALQVNKVSTLNYVKSKYILFVIPSVISYFITLPYGFLSTNLIFINLAIVIYHIGVTSILIMFFGTYNTKSMDLGSTQFMNYQGSSASNFLIVLPIFGLPIFVYLSLYLFGVSKYSFHVIAAIGLIAIIFNKYLLQMVANQLAERKYKMTLGFRQK